MNCVARKYLKDPLEAVREGKAVLQGSPQVGVARTRLFCSLSTEESVLLQKVGLDPTKRECTLFNEETIAYDEKTAASDLFHPSIVKGVPYKKSVLLDAYRKMVEQRDAARKKVRLVRKEIEWEFPGKRVWVIASMLPFAIMVLALLWIISSQDVPAITPS